MYEDLNMLKYGNNETHSNTGSKIYTEQVVGYEYNVE